MSDAGTEEDQRIGGVKTMKKTVVAKMLALLLMMSLMLGAAAACGSSGSNGSSGSAQPEKETAEDASEEPESDEADSEELSSEFKKTMDDYEAWFDHYCEVMKKYNENPSDMELLSEMTDLISEEAEMLDQMENMDQSEMNKAELAYYLEVTARIEKKLLEVAY